MKILKKTLSVLLSLLLLCNIFAFGAMAQATDNPSANLTNLVFFVRFAGDTQDIFNESNAYGKSNRTTILNMFNDTSSGNTYGIDYSFKNYIKNISNGQVIVNNYFPQDNGTTIATITLAGNLDSYSDDYDILEEVINATRNGTVTVPSEIKLDNREAGILDTMTVILQGSTYESDNPVLYPHKSVAGNETKIANRATVRSYLFIDSYSLMSAQQQGVISHEFLHTLGFPDLYRNNGDSGSPVGVWDIMGGASMYQQYPLTYMRSIHDWVTIDTINSKGTYTLNPVTTTEGDQAFIIKTPLSDSEFFVVEYRVRNTSNPVSLGFETKVPETGLLVYRVNTAVENLTNVAGDDYIYIFRPGETSLTASAGEILKASVNPSSTTNPRTSIGSTDMDETFDNGTLFYSDGLNSGIAISNVKYNNGGESLSFDLDFADYSAIDMWDKMGEIIDNAASYSISTDVAAQNEIYTSYEVVADMGYNIKSAKWNGTAWSSLGSTLTNASSPVIKKFGNTLYLFYQKNGVPTLAKLNGSSWQTVYTDNSVSYPYGCDLIMDGTGLFLTYTASTGSGYAINIKEVTSSGVTDYADSYTNADYIVNPQLCFHDGELYGAFSIMSFGSGSSTDTNSRVVKYNDIFGTWETVNTFSVKTGNVNQLVSSDGKLFAVGAVSGKAPQLGVFDGTTWTNTVLDALPLSYAELKLGANDGIPYFSCITNNVLKVFKLENEEISQVGSDVASAANSSDFDIGFNTAYSTVMTGSGVLALRYKQIATSEEATLTGIAVKSNPSKVAYEVGDTLDQTGLVITATYSDGSEKDVSTGFTCSPTSFDSYGTKSVTVTFEGKTTTFDVTVTCSDSSHVWNSGVITKAPTCTVNGVKTFTCTLCGDTKTEVINATGHHDYTSVVTAPTCHADGFTTYTCAEGDHTYTVTDENSKLSHAWNSGVVTKAPTCTVNGVKTFTCTLCGDTKTEVITATGHHDYTSVVTTPTCHADGFTTYICADGDHTYTVTDENSKLSHVWNSGVVTKAPTCTVNGVKTFTCTLCGDTKTEVINATGHHDYTSVVTAPTCHADGFTTYTCAEGDHTYTVTDENSKLSHVWGDGVVTKAPTCTVNGVKTFTCTLCGDTKTEVINATGHHDYTSVVTAPTCHADGFTTYTCAEGDHTYTVTAENSKLSHVWDSGVVTKAPTCTANGVKTFTCTLCGDTKTEVINATGHVDADEDGICDECGESTDPSANCDCICHSKGIMNFFYRILRIFWKIFGINKTCDCGAVHY